MKVRLNITIDERLLHDIKVYAANKQTSVSELVEEFFRSLSRPARKASIIDLADKLPPPHVDVTGDLKKKYYESQSGKYGFKSND